MGKFFKWVGIIVAVVIGLAVIGNLVGEEEGATSSSSTSNTTPQSNSSGSSSRPSRTEGAIGQRFEGRLIAAQVDGISTAQRVGIQYMEETAARGAIFVVVRFSYTNISEAPVGSFRRPEIQLVSGSGTEFSEDAGASAMFAAEADIDENAFSDLNPGIEYDGAAVFEIAESMLSNEGWAVKVELDRGAFYVPFSAQ